jgi:hypothetical protein
LPEDYLEEPKLKMTSILCQDHLLLCLAILHLFSEFQDIEKMMLCHSLDPYIRKQCVFLELCS